MDEKLFVKLWNAQLGHNRLWGDDPVSEFCSFLTTLYVNAEMEKQEKSAYLWKPEFRKESYLRSKAVSIALKKVDRNIVAAAYALGVHMERQRRKKK